MSIFDKFKILTYNVGFISKPIGKCLSDGIKESDITWMKHHYNDRFFADPFLLKEDRENLYIACEELTFWEEKGRISVLTVSKRSFSLLSKVTLIEEPYHLSFPFCEKDGNRIVPEASSSGKTFSYRIDPDKLTILEKKEILKEGLIDNVFYTDPFGTEWIFAGHTVKPSYELYEYKKGNNEKYQIMNGGHPIEDNNRTTRGAGRFFSYEGKLYRPVQDCKGRYGRQTAILQIDTIGDQGYKATKICELNSDNNPPYNETMHTFNVYDDIIIVDGSKDFIRFPSKIAYRKMRWMFKKRK